ncbi:MAG: hypothetical protein F4Y08_14860 [Caldilineaceae bacterium SB0662_bin_9]|uniref:Transposase n=1 Tax=Caldilineaceae bacterium SB0662_bin_9 TaxID=2605258 RepID=A0A6B1DX42_9CHLR|nr:hypothetical protein [Caldilineaceae bacterium SB0662_bin_9]
MRNILALTPCGKPQTAHFAHVTELLQWLPGRLNFIGLEHYGGRSARTHARWFARPFPFARLAVAELGALHPRVPEGLGELLALDASFVAKSGDKTWGMGWFWSGMARAARWALEVTLLTAVDVEEGGALRPAIPGHRPACGADTGQETALDAALALLGEAVAAGAREILGALGGRGGRAPTGPAHGGPPAQGRGPALPLRRSHARRPGRKRRCDGCFDRPDPARMARTTRKKEKVDLYHAVLHAKAWQCWLRVVYVLPRGTDPETKEGVLLDGTDTDLAPERIFRFHGTRFQIEFAFRDAKQHLGLNHGQARSQARLRAERPLGPFSLRDRKRGNLEEEIHKRFATRSAAGQNASNSEAGRGRIPPERLWLRTPPPEAGPAGP